MINHIYIYSILLRLSFYKFLLTTQLVVVTDLLPWWYGARSVCVSANTKHTPRYIIFCVVFFSFLSISGNFVGYVFTYYNRKKNMLPPKCWLHQTWSGRVQGIVLLGPFKWTERQEKNSNNNRIHHRWSEGLARPGHRRVEATGRKK